MFGYSEPVLRRYPTIVGGVVHARAFANDLPPPEVASTFRDEQLRALERTVDQSLSDLPVLTQEAPSFQGIDKGSAS